MSKRIKLDWQLVREVYESGRGMKSIAKEHGVSEPVIARILRKLGVKSHSKEYWASRYRKIKGSLHPNWTGGRTTNSAGYVQISTPSGKIYEHRLVMEKSIGRKLNPGEVVHHKDGNKQNNNIENLELIESQGNHCKIHPEFNRWGKYKKLAILYLVFAVFSIRAQAYLGVNTNRFLPIFAPTGPFKASSYQWTITNSGESSILLSNDIPFFVWPAVAGVDCNVRPAWDALSLLNRQTTNKLVAIIDTGVATNHPDLTSVRQGVTVSFGSISIGQTDSGAGAGHGTAIAGIISAVGSKANDDGRLCGLAPGCPILPIHSDINWPSHSNSWWYAITNGAKLISCAWGYSSPPDGMEFLVQRSLASNCIIVQASVDGDFVISTNNLAQMDWPGSFYPQYPNVLSVTALAPDGSIYQGAAKGAWLIAAPGRSLALVGRPSYAFQTYGNGTSFAEPHVLGACVLVWSMNPGLSAVEVANRVRGTLDPLDGCMGKLNIGRAVGETCIECPVIRPPFVLTIQGNVLVIDRSDTVIVQQSLNLVDWSLFTNTVGPVKIPLQFDGQLKFFRGYQRISEP